MAYIHKEMDLVIKDTVFNPTLNKKDEIFYKTKGNNTLYKVWVYLDGPDLPYVWSVTYKLHKTFKNSEKKVFRKSSNEKCKLVIWTWGLFKVKAIVENKEGEFFVLEHNLEYDRELRKKGVNFIKVED